MGYLYDVAKAFCENNGLTYSEIEAEWLTAERYTKRRSEGEVSGLE